MSKICGIDWSYDDENLIVSSGQDNLIKVWNTKNTWQCEQSAITSEPAWRARFTPFGKGIVSMPQKNDFNLYLYSLNNMDSPISTFHGHEDLGARMTPKIFERLKLPLDTTMKFVQKLVQLHLRPIALTKSEVSDSALRRLLFDAGDDIDALMILCKADITSKNELKVKKYLKNYEHVIEKLVALEEKDRVRNFQPPVSGEIIMGTFGLSPCSQVGIIKNAIKDAILDGVIENDAQQAHEYMLKLGADLGLQAV